jgi:hypothetical protein
MNASTNRRGVVFSVVVLLALGLYLILPSASPDERLYAALLKNQAALERISGGNCRIRDWATAFSHFKFEDPETYYRENQEKLKGVMKASGYLVTVTQRIPDLAKKTKQTQVSQNMIHVYEHSRGHAWYESAFNFDRSEISVLCRKLDIPLWEDALKRD